MGAPLTTPRELLAARLRRLLWVELTLADEVLPELLDAARATDLRSALERHLLETQEHARVVRGLLAGLGTGAQPEESAALRGLVAEHEQLVQGIDPSGRALLDLAHAEAAVHAEHLEIAAYDALASLADALGEEDVATELRCLMEQEQFALEQVERSMTRLLAERVEAARL